jgi:hypothetical protein
MSNYPLFYEKLRQVWLQNAVALLLNIITWLYIYMVIEPSEELVPLHYSVVYGADYVDKGYYIYILPLTGLVILFLNYMLYHYISKKEIFAGKLLIISALAVQIFLFIAVLFLKSVTTI